ncbi:MAG: ABC transporter permease [Thermoleophilia bacterium]|nr:ABC transporter permease [Thermoleophilia bacterium]
MTLALVMGQFDLSIGAATTMGGILVTKILAGPQWPIPLAIAVTIGGGVVLGLINAFVVNRLRVTAFIATLGTMSILTGVYHWYSNDSTVYYGIPPAFTDIATTRVVGVPMPVVIMVATLILLWVFLERTQTGRHIKATGGNYQAARLSGIRVGRMIAIGFVVSGICAFLAGIVLASQLGAGQLNAGEGFLLNSFAAAFIGAAVLKPGQFHIVGTLVGVLLLGVLVNGFLLLNVDSSFQYMVSGAVLIVALAISGISGRHPRA